MVGRLALREFPGLAINNHLWINGNSWIIVGVFESNSDAHESEILADASTLQSSAAGVDYSSATVRLSDPKTFDIFKAAVSDIPGMNLKVLRESEYYKGQSETISNLTFMMAYVVSTIMAIGATCGVLNIMYSIVDSRAVEIATLRAFGFGSTPIIISILAEAMFLGFVGACVGVCLAWFFYSGRTFSTEQYLGVGASVNHMVFSLDFTPRLVLTGMVWAIVIGMLGALSPAVQITRGPVAPGLRAS
jgi:putative ABC transport system permease protein